MLEGIIPSPTRRKLLALFFLNSKSRFYVREIERKSGENISAVRRELGILEKAGLAICQRQGNMVYYSANLKSPIFAEIRSIMLKTDGMGGVIKEALAGQAGLKFAFIYGSYARGEERAGSDVDLMIIGDVKPEAASIRIRDAEKKIGREINYSVYPEKEFGKEASKGFIRAVLKGEKVMLIGDKDGLERAAEGGKIKKDNH